MPGHFSDLLVQRLRQLGHPLCVGLDPHPDRIPPLFGNEATSLRDPRTVDGVGSFLLAVLERLAGRVAIVKPQIAFFECLGWPGLRLLESIVGRARELGLMVLLDAKRGDIGSTAAAYAEAYFGEEAHLKVDALTVQPYLGEDSLEPFVDRATSTGGGVFVLVRTSNPGARDFQDLRLATDPSPEGPRGELLFERVASSLAPLADRMRGPVTGWSSLGVVAAATWPGESERIRELLPRSLFLVPGYGAQGGTAADAVRGFVPGPGGRLEGGIVNSSRGILFPEGSFVGDRRRWEQALDGAVDRAVGELAEAVA